MPSASSLFPLSARLRGLSKHGRCNGMALDRYILTHASCLPFDILTQLSLHKAPSSNHAHFWLMPMPTMMIEEPLFAVVIAYAACLYAALKHPD